MLILLHRQGQEGGSAAERVSITAQVTRERMQSWYWDRKLVCLPLELLFFVFFFFFLFFLVLHLEVPRLGVELEL